MGMRQRLAIAAALLGDPRGADPRRADQRPRPAGHQLDAPAAARAGRRTGRAVLVSSHLLAEVAQSVDDVVIIANGEMRGRGTLEEVLGGDEGAVTEVRAQDPERLAERARAARATGSSATAPSLLVLGTSPEDVGADRARGAGGADRPRAADALAREPPSSRSPGASRERRCCSAELLKLRTRAPSSTLVSVTLVLVAARGRGPDRDPQRRLHRAGRARAVHRRLLRASSSCCSA